MSKSEISFPAVRIIKQVKGYKEAVDEVTKATAKEFFDEYLMPMVRKRFSKFAWRHNLEAGLKVKVVKTDSGYSFKLTSETRNEENEKYFGKVITGKPKRKEPFARLKAWVEDKIDPEPELLFKTTYNLKRKISLRGSRPKTNLMPSIEADSQSLIDGELMIILRRKMKNLRRRFPKG